MQLFISFDKSCTSYSRLTVNILKISILGRTVKPIGCSVVFTPEDALILKKGYICASLSAKTLGCKMPDKLT